MAKGKARDLAKEARWRKMVGAQRRSGQNVRQYCRERELAESAFWFWKRELARRDAERGEDRTARQRLRGRLPSLVPVTIGPAIAHAAAVEVALPRGVSLRISAGCEEALLRMVLSALASRT